MAYVLVVRMTAREGEEARAAELLAELSAASREEPGNLQYAAHRDAEDPRTFLVYEVYADKAAFESHGATEHFQRIALGELFPLMEGDRRREFYTSL